MDVRSHVRLKAGMQLANEIFVGCIRHFSIVLEYSTFHGRGPQAEKAGSKLRVAGYLTYVKTNEITTISGG